MCPRLFACVCVYVCVCSGSLLMSLDLNFPGYDDMWKNGRDNVELHPVFMRYGNEDVDHVGIESIYVRPCHSKKFSFVKAATENGITKELMYIYEPMGLDRQADQMGCILARFQCRNLAACFLWILQTKLDMKLMEVFVTHGTSCSISKP